MELAFRADSDLAAPVYRQLAAHLQGLIQAGRLAAGQKLPPSRELAATLALSRNTVNARAWPRSASWSSWWIPGSPRRKPSRPEPSGRRLFSEKMTTWERSSKASLRIY